MRCVLSPPKPTPSRTVGVRHGGKLCHRTKSRIGRLRIGKRRKAARADRLKAVHLRQVWLVYGTSADVLSMEASRSSQLMFQAKAPLHEIWRVKFSVGYGRDGDRRKTCRGIRLCRGAGELALCEP